MLYRITATVTDRTNRTWTYSTPLPTFFLDSAVQGIVSSSHATDIAGEMIRSLIGPSDGHVHLTVIEEASRADYVTVVK